MNTALLPKRLMWFQRDNYRIVPLNSSLHLPALALEQAIRQGVPAWRDANRVDFYDVELNHGSAYIHVRDDAQVVYLVAYFDAGRPIHAVTQVVIGPVPQ